jgi:arsenate reductase (glutaredoxin)
MITLYHNTLCSKSRCTVEILKKHKVDVEIIEYLKCPPSEKDLKIILKKLNMNAEDIVRKKESLFQQKFSGKKFSEKEWIRILVKNPILIERPIAVKGNKAVIGRPPENVEQLL